jgi:hypothetical protein
LTKGHICVFALFEAVNENGEAADKASEMFMNTIMKYDITKKPAKDVIKKCLLDTEKKVKKAIPNENYKVSVAAFAGKELTACVRGGRMFIVPDDGKANEFTSNDIEIMSAGTSWKNVMMVSDGYSISADEVKDDMVSPTGDLITKRNMRSSSDASSMIRAQRL